MRNSSLYIFAAIMSLSFATSSCLYSPQEALTAEEIKQRRSYACMALSVTIPVFVPITGLVCYLGNQANLCEISPGSSLLAGVTLALTTGLFLVDATTGKFRLE